MRRIKQNLRSRKYNNYPVMFLRNAAVSMTLIISMTPATASANNGAAKQEYENANENESQINTVQSDVLLFDKQDDFNSLNIPIKKADNRLIVKLTEKDAAALAETGKIPDAIARENIITHIGALYLLGYDSAESASYAADNLNDKVEYIEKDVSISATSNDSGNSKTKNASKVHKGQLAESLEASNMSDSLKLPDLKFTSTQNKNDTEARQTSSVLVDSQKTLSNDDELEQSPARIAGGPVRVAVLDTGSPDKSMDENAVSVISDSIKDDSGHATQVIGAISNQAPNASVIPIKVLDKNGTGTTFSIYAGIEAAIAAKADVINISAAGKAPEGSRVLSDAIADVKQAGAIVIASAGNENEDVANYVPASCEHVIAVGASDENDIRQPDSNHGSGIDVWGSRHHSCRSGWQQWIRCFWLRSC